jgi:hypothetical protein
VDVKSEHRVAMGKLDIAVLVGKIELKYGRKIIAIEIKSGKTVDSKLFNQIQRYLSGVDLLLIVRIPTNDVVPIDSAAIRSVIINEVNLLTRKAEKMLAGDVTRVPGDWCKECTANREFRKPQRSPTIRYTSFQGYEDYLISVDKIIEKIVAILQ